MKISPRINRIIEAPVDRINKERLRLESKGASILNLGQAIPNFPPPEVTKSNLLKALDNLETHQYTPDAGIIELRRAVAMSLRDKYNVSEAQSEEIIITAGANHAFLLVCHLLLQERERFGLLSPFFLGHKMVIEGCGGVVVEIEPDHKFNYPPARIERAIVEHKLRALVVVNPSNPTGKVFTQKELETLLKICKKHEIWLVSDEVYRAFVYNPVSMTSIGSLPDSSERTIIIGSFSKEFGMTGWRVGWLRAPRQVIPHLLKAQNYSIICSPHPSQIIALSALKQVPNWTDIHLKDFAKRKQELAYKLRNSGIFKVYSGDGAFFIWFRPYFNVDADQEVFELMRKANVCIMPGSIFGKKCGSWFRISYGSQSLNQLREAVARIIWYFTCQCG